MLALVLVSALAALQNDGTQADPSALVDNARLPSCGLLAGPVVTHIDDQLPSVGTPATVEVGQSMVAHLKYNVMFDAITLLNSISFSGRYFLQSYKVDIPAERLQRAGWMGDVIYKSEGYTFKYSNDAHPRTGIARPQLIIKYSAASGLTGYLWFGFTQQPIDLPADSYRLEKCIAGSGDGFRRELVYSGVSQGAITLLYREFIGNLARPAFPQELHYDLKEGNEIGYRGARFKILKADNSGITYVVEKPLE